MSNLLKFARIQQNEEFVSRVSAATLIRAREIGAWEMTDGQRAFITYVTDNPLVSVPAMVIAVATNTSVINNVNIADGVADAAEVPDGDIQFAVNENMFTVADKMFPPA